MNVAFVYEFLVGALADNLMRDSHGYPFWALVDGLFAPQVSEQ